MSDTASTVTIIIATTAGKNREADIRRAVASIRLASNKPVSILAYVNGNRFSIEVCNWLKEQTDVNYCYSEIGSFPLALHASRKLVKTDYFGFLDDDDELLPGSIDLRLALFTKDSNLDVAVGNGVRKIGNNEVVTQPDIEYCRKDPLRSLLRKNGNWLASCAGLFKTASFEHEFFEDFAPYSEWTYIAFRIASTKQISFTQELTYRINFTDNSLSAGLSYLKGQYNCVRKILKLNLPKDVRKVLNAKAVNLSHDVAHSALADKSYWTALRYHLTSMSSIFGFRKYVMFSRYFFFQ